MANPYLQVLRTPHALPMVLAAFVGRLLELPSASWGRLAPLGNCCWSVLVEHPAGWRLEQHGAGLDVAPATVTGADRRPL